MGAPPGGTEGLGLCAPPPHPRPRLRLAAHLQRPAGAPRPTPHARADASQGSWETGPWGCEMPVPGTPQSMRTASVSPGEPAEESGPLSPRSGSPASVRLRALGVRAKHVPRGRRCPQRCARRCLPPPRGPSSCCRGATFVLSLLSFSRRQGCESDGDGPFPGGPPGGAARGVGVRSDPRNLSVRGRRG